VGEKKDWEKLINGVPFMWLSLCQHTKLDELKVHSHLVLKDSSIKSPNNTSSQPGRDLSCNCRWQNSVGLNSLKSHGHPLPITYTIYIYIYICMYVCMYVCMYTCTIYICVCICFFYYEYSTIVFDLALVWNLISDLIYDHFCEFCVCVCVCVCLFVWEEVCFFFLYFFFPPSFLPWVDHL